MRYTRTTMGDIAVMLNSIRPMDAEELRLSGQSVPFALGYATTESYITLSANDDETGRLFYICGLVRNPQSEEDDIIWGLGTVEMDKYPLKALKMTRQIGRLLMDASKAKRFHNIIPAEYATYRKWLENHFNATFDSEFIHHGGAKFVAFHITKGN